MPKGRPRQFDHDQVLDQAIDVYWEHGCNGVGTRQLCEATGLNQSSLYNTFGDKDSIFAAALARYAETKLWPLFEALEDDRPPVAALSTLISIWESHNTQADTPGCLFTHTLGEVGMIGAGPIPQATAKIAARLSRGIERRFHQADELGELPADSDPSQLASTFLVSGLGIAMAGRAGIDPSAIHGIARTMYQLIGCEGSARTGP